MSILKDGGVKSRKLWLAVGTSVAIVISGVVAAKFPTIGPLYDTMVGGLLGVLALYLSGNVATKYTLSKGVKPEPSAEASPPVEGA